MNYTEKDLKLAHSITKKFNLSVWGSIWIEEWAYLYNLVKKHKPKSIIEIGSFYHLSSTAFLKGIEDNKTGHLLSLDISFPNPEFTYPNVLWTKLEASSHDILPKLINKYDMVFIDGDHSAEAVIKDIKNSLKILSHNGIIVMHDTNYPPTRAAIKSILNDKVKYWSFKKDKFHGIGIYKSQ
jgi:predicted O-methyltransferase YrrM